MMIKKVTSLFLAFILILIFNVNLSYANEADLIIPNGSGSSSSSVNAGGSASAGGGAAGAGMGVTAGPNEPAPEISQNAAKDIATGFLADSAYQITNIYLNPDYGMGYRTWSVDLFKGAVPGGSANIGINSETGKIISFNLWDNYDPGQNFIAKFTRSEAEIKAEEYIKNVLKEDLSTYKLQDDLFQNQYYSYPGGTKQPIIVGFTYLKKLNGTVFPNYSISVGVDCTSGIIRNFSINIPNFDPAAVPDMNNIVPEDKIFEALKDSTSMQLQYVSFYPENYTMNPVPRTKLVFIPVQNTMYDAKTGKALTYDGSEPALSQKSLEFQKHPVALDPGAKLIDKAIAREEADKLANKYKVSIENLLNVKFDQNPGGISQISGYQQTEQILYYNWNCFNDTKNTSANISINILTGHVTALGFNSFDSKGMEVQNGNLQQTPVKESITWEDAKKKAIEAIKSLLPDYYGFFTDEAVEKPEYVLTDTSMYHTFTFTRLVNNIRFRDNNIYAGINKTTGNIDNFNFNWTDADFDPADKTVSENDAKEAYCKDLKLDLMYTQFYKFVNGQQIPDKKLKLVYVASNKFSTLGEAFIDALSGKPVDYSGNIVDFQQISKPVAPDGHWAKRSIDLLMSQGILKNTGKDCDSVITRFDALKMLVFAKGYPIYDQALFKTPSFTDVNPDNENYINVENAVRQKILQPGGKLDGDAKMTKGEFCRLLVNLTGYADLASHNEIFKTGDLKNVPEVLAGYVAICKALGILPVKQGDVFDASSEVTLAEASVALYNALTYIK